MTKLTHRVLVQRAARWLTNTRRCVLVLEEAQCWSVGEFPDAIGWLVGGHSVLVECKMSRADFHADKRKPSRRMGVETMGTERWYMAPPMLLQPSDLPPGYGLLEVNGRQIRKIVQADRTERPGAMEAEVPLLIWATRKKAWARGCGRQIRLVVGPHPAERELDTLRKAVEVFADLEGRACSTITADGLRGLPGMRSDDK